jgi:phytoene synthase
MAAFLPLSLVEPYLKAAVKPKRDVLVDLADISPLSRVMRLWFAHWRGRI